VLPSLLKTTLMLFREKAREVIKSAVGFVRICVAAMTPEELQPLVGDVVEGLMKWNHGKDRFRAKIKIILKKLVMRYGFEHVKQFVPKEDERLMTHIRKIAERQQRKKEKNGGQTVRGSVYEGDFEDMLDSDEEDSDGARTLMTGMTGFTQMTAGSGKSLKNAAVEKSERQSMKSKAESMASAKSSKSGKVGEGDGVLVREGQDYDMLDASMAKNLKYQVRAARREETLLPLPRRFRAAFHGSELATSFLGRIPPTGASLPHRSWAAYHGSELATSFLDSIPRGASLQIVPALANPLSSRRTRTAAATTRTSRTTATTR
jgi:ribosomal RNA-processing protein 12